MINFIDVNASMTVNPGSLSYSITLPDNILDEVYRARLFLNYEDSAQAYTTTAHYGLMETSGVAEYDDWDSALRPPRIDSEHGENFNTEIRYPLVAGVNTFVLHGIDRHYRECESITVSGASMLPSVSTKNPRNLIIERQISDIEIRSVTSTGTSVTVITAEPHGFETGDAITITGLPVAGSSTSTLTTTNHILGENGGRFMGTFLVKRINPTSFSYQTKHYNPNTPDVSYNKIGRAEKWELVSYYNVETLHIDPDSGTATISSASLQAEEGDFFTFDYDGATANERGIFTNIKVDSVDSSSEPNTYTFLCTGATRKLDVQARVYNTPVLPSKSIPVNFPTIETSAGGHKIVLDNASEYAHTINTLKAEPIVDTYVVEGGIPEFSSNPTLISSRGNMNTIVAMKFAVGHLNTLEGIGTLGLYVSGMNYSSGDIVVYQMSSSEWDTGMTYDELSKYVTNIPVASMVVNNGRMDGYNNYIELELNADIVKKWLNNTYQYPAAIAVMIKNKGNPSITFNSTENAQFHPYLLITSGEKAIMKPETFNISIGTSSAIGGETIRLLVSDYSGSFGNYVFNNEVYFDGVKGVIVSGNSNYIDVVVPDTVTGNVSIVVKSVLPNGTLIDLTKPYNLYIKNDAYYRNTILADKIRPGVNEDKRVSVSATYNRDLGFNNFAEITDETSLIQNLYSCLLTNKGERLFNYRFGSTIERRIFTIATLDDTDEIIKECMQVVAKYEPRVTIDPDLSSVSFDEGMNTIKVKLCILLPTHRHEYIYLTFKDRGQ